MSRKRSASDLQALLGAGGFDQLNAGALDALGGFAGPEQFAQMMTVIGEARGAGSGLGGGGDGHGGPSGGALAPGAGGGLEKAGGAGLVGPSGAGSAGVVKPKPAAKAPQAKGPPKLPPKAKPPPPKAPPKKQAKATGGAAATKTKKLAWDPIDDPSGTAFMQAFSQYLTDLPLGDVEEAFSKSAPKTKDDGKKEVKKEKVRDTYCDESPALCRSLDCFRMPNARTT